MNLLMQYPKIVFFTGAGMSADSGVPTFRGEGGMWHQYRYQDYACQEAFERDPEAVWEFNNMRRRAVAECRPHRGYELLTELTQARAEAGLGPGGGVTIVTQNIDGMHQASGAGEVYELHGSMWKIRCDVCGVAEENREVPLEQLKHSCGNYWRPDIVWFGDSLKRNVLSRSVDAISRCRLFVSIGTSAVVFPAARLPQQAISVGATLIEINPERTAVSNLYQKHMRGGAEEMLAQLLAT